MKKNYAFVIYLCLTIFSVKAQMYVTTLGNGNCNLGEAVCDDYGNIYFCDRSSCSQIKKIDTAGTVSVYASTPGQDPANLILDSAVNLYVAYHWSSQKKIVRIPPGGGAPIDYVTGILDTYGAGPMLFDHDTLYFGEYGTQRIYKVLPGGGAVGGPNVIPIQNTNLGISGVSNERLYDMQWMADGSIMAVVKNKLYKVNKVTGNATLLASFPSDVLAIAIINGTGYFTMWGQHYVYSFDTTNYNYNIFAGTGTAGNLDGPVNSAQFNQPYNLSADNFGNLIVTDFNSGKVRRIWGCNALTTNISTSPICINDTLYLTANPNGGNYNTYTYQWSHSNGFAANTKDTFMIVNPSLYNTYVYCQVTDLLGCSKLDSVLIQDLSSSSNISVASCGNYTSPSGNFIWNSNGIYNDTISNTAGCDSIITINLTINPIPNTSVSQSNNVLTANQSGASYQWVNCNNNFSPISGATAQSFTALNNGSYAVIVSLNGCTDTSSCFSVSVPTSIENLNTDREAFKVFPNPSQGNFTIYALNEGIFDLMDYTGRIINSYQSGKGYIEINQNLPRGMYFIKEYNSGSIQKLIIE